ncbi:MAG: MBL fold metallo-hydrolase [Candidatus Latescibacteria bacterium]|nr:MBL fold metallo-hydrolase [bacterium]MBD3422948.1 MBL fold metallo-hydrolase [Candidatus Latescibacterota bacterium]
MMFEVTVLGSGTIIPAAGRGATSILIRTAEEIILFDCGPSAPGAAAANGIALSSIDSVFISHFHPDHSLGLGHFIAAARNDPGYPSSRRIPLYGPEGMDSFLESWNSVYPSFGAGPDLFRPVTVRGLDRLQLKDSEITAIRARHGSGPALSYRLKTGGGVFVYTGDTALTQELIDFSRGADLLAAECSFPDESGMKGHMTISDAGRLAAEAGPARVLLVHMYPSVDPEIAREDVRKLCRAEVLAGSDGLSLRVGK